MMSFFRLDSTLKSTTAPYRLVFMVAESVEFLVIAGIIIFGFFGEQFFRRTGVPSFLFLIFIGILLGPVFGVFPRASLVSALGIFATLTLLIVLFYGGLDTRLPALAAGGGRALLQVFLYVIPGTIAIAALAVVLLHWEPIQSLVFASMVGGETTAAVMVPLSRSLKLSESVVAFLTLESAMNSVVSIVLFFAFVSAYQAGTSDYAATLSSIVGNFSIGLVFGAALSLAWVLLLSRLKSQRYTYVFTIGLIFLTYSVTSLVGGSGQLAVLVFGITLGNYSLINYLSKVRINMDALQSQLRLFHGEISFLLETLFFVSLGLTFVIQRQEVATNLGIGLVMLGALIAIRFCATRVSTANSDMSLHSGTITLLCAQGLTPATLAIIAVNLGLPLANSYLSLVTYVIIFTNVVTAIGSFWTMRKRKYPIAEFTAGLGGLA